MDEFEYGNCKKCGVKLDVENCGCVALYCYDCGCPYTNVWCEDCPEFEEMVDARSYLMAECSWRKSKRNIEMFNEREDIRDRAIEKLIKSEMDKAVEK